MEKERLGVIFGGMSTENEVSVVSANSVIKNLDREKYEIYPIYIDKNGIWYEYSDLQEERKLGEKVDKKNRISDLIGYLKKLDILFPILHGLYGEDGTVQGLFELLKKPYVGCGVLASSIGMDKVYTKIIFEKAGLNQAKYEYVRKYNEKYNEKAKCKMCTILQNLQEKKRERVRGVNNEQRKETSDQPCDGAFHESVFVGRMQPAGWRHRQGRIGRHR